MGLVICDKHGGQGFFEICEHIELDIENGIYPKMVKFPIFNVKICQDCYDRVLAKELPNMPLSEFILNPNKLDLEDLEKSLNQKYEKINRVMMCWLCDLEHQLTHARKQGQEDPFEAFENTLTFKEEATIKALETHLFDNFHFKPSIVESDKKALFIFKGHIKEPLLIQIYYVTKNNEQHKVLKLIDDFFRSQKLTQRRIQFLEKEIWTEEQKIGYKSYHRGEEKIIRDITIK